jgi:drug/metabolite transporter (DMT)-like permease
MRALGAGTEVVGLRVADVPSPAALLLKTRLLTIIVVLTQVMGDYFLSYGLRRGGSLVGRPPLDFIVALTNPWVALGVLLLILWLFSHMVLLSWADLSYVLPVTSIGYVLVTLTGRFLLHETVSWMRWGGVILIVAGVILVGRTAPSTKPLQPEEGA